MKNEKMPPKNSEEMKDEELDQVSGGLFGFDEEEWLVRRNRTFKDTWVYKAGSSVVDWVKGWF